MHLARSWRYGVITARGCCRHRYPASPNRKDSVQTHAKMQEWRSKDPDVAPIDGSSSTVECLMTSNANKAGPPRLPFPPWRMVIISSMTSPTVLQTVPNGMAKMCAVTL